MGTRIVMVEQQSAGAGVWTACTSSLEDLCVDRLPLLERDRGHMTGFGEEDRDHEFGSASRPLEFF